MKHIEGPHCDLCNFKLTMADPLIREWFLASKKAYVNLHVSCTFRDEHAQNQLFKVGKSRLRWPNSLHNHKIDLKPCSRAADVFLIDQDGIGRFPQPFYAKLWEFSEKHFKGRMYWGYHFKDFKDGPHFQLRGH